jgi:hypothetical protein
MQASAAHDPPLSPPLWCTANADTGRAAIIRQTVTGMVLSTLHPRTVITVVVQVVRDDGSLLAAALNAATLALLDAGIPLRWMLSAVCIACPTDGTLRLDPDLEEEKAAANALTLAFGGTDSAAAAAAAAADARGLVTSDVRGVVNEKAFAACISAGPVCALRRPLCAPLRPSLLTALLSVRMHTFVCAGDSATRTVTDHIRRELSEQLRKRTAQ